MSVNVLREFISMIKIASAFILATCLITACSIDRDKQVAREKITFTTTDDSEIFFKNMRASYYEKEERKETYWEIYRSEDLYADTSDYAIKAAIVINILKDQAYLLIEPGQRLSELNEIIIYAYDSETSKEQQIILGIPNKEAMLEFGTQLYEALRDKKTLTLKVNDQSIPVLDDPEKREAFRRTLADYYRLTNIF